MAKLKFGLIQFPIQEKQSYEAFLAKNLAYLERAKDLGLDMLIFPELTALDMIDFKSDLAPQWKWLIGEIAPRYFEWFLQKSKEYNFTILTGSSPLKTEKGIINRCTLIERGQLLLNQDKIYLTPEEENVWKWQNSPLVQVFNYKGVKTCILICHDSEFPELSQTLSAEKIELLLVPSMTSNIYGLNRVRWCSQARAIEHHCYALVTGTVEAESSRGEYVGQAAFITPQNLHFSHQIQTGAFNVDDLLVCELDFEKLRLSRSQIELIYPVRDQLRRSDKIELKHI